MMNSTESQWSSLWAAESYSERCEALRELVDCRPAELLCLLHAECEVISRNQRLEADECEGRCSFFAVRSRKRNTFDTAISYLVDFDEGDWCGGELTLYAELTVGRIPSGYYFDGYREGSSYGERRGKTSFIWLTSDSAFLHSVDADIPKLAFYSTNRVGGKTVHKCAWRAEDIELSMLEQKLKSRSPCDRIFALRRIASLAHGRCIEPANADPEEHGLSRWDEPVHLDVDESLFIPLADLVASLIHDDDADLRKAAVNALSCIPRTGECAQNTLIEAIHDQNEDVCIAAVDALIGPARADKSLQPALFAAMNHPLLAVRRKVYNALIHFTDSPLRKDIPEMIAAIKTESDTELTQARLQGLYYETTEFQPEDRKQLYRQLLGDDFSPVVRSFAAKILANYES